MYAENLSKNQDMQLFNNMANEFIRDYFDVPATPENIACLVSHLIAFEEEAMKRQVFVKRQINKKQSTPIIKNKEEVPCRLHK